MKGKPSSPFVQRLLEDPELSLTSRALIQEYVVGHENPELAYLDLMLATTAAAREWQAKVMAVPPVSEER